MTLFERRLWRWAWRMRVRIDARRGDLQPAPFAPRPRERLDADGQAYYAGSILLRSSGHAGAASAERP